MTNLAEPAGVATGARDKRDYRSDQQIRWCPGCGDYAILAQFHKMLAAVGANKEDHVIVSGIGCASRFPYYVDTYGLHGVHGRAPAIATGIKAVNPSLTVWVVTGDGDALSIGVGHLIHALRRNVDIKILLLNNAVYGLTKGQASPTSFPGQVTPSSPAGVVDRSLNPLRLALTAGATFVARCVDSHGRQMRDVLIAAAEHRGAALVEIWQNCPVFNDGAFVQPSRNYLHLRPGQPITVGGDGERALTLDQGGRLGVQRTDDADPPLLRHDVGNAALAGLLADIEGDDLPVPVGIYYRCTRPVHSDALRPEPPLRGRRSAQELLDAGRIPRAG
jgi:2-oxoglutarate ferredoxin oxidoreductase subunit beta